MKYATYEQNGVETAGIITEEGFYPFEALLGEPLTMLGFIQKYAGKPLPAFDRPAQTAAPLNPAALRLKAPIPRPARNIICLGKNYLDHVNEVKSAGVTVPGPEHPMFFTKSAFAIIGSGEDIPAHEDVTNQADYEAELAVIIGAECDHVAEEHVKDRVFGYTILNDMTARDIQARHGQWFLGKSLDGFCPMGPYIVGADEVPFPPALDIRSRVNGETRQNSNTGRLIFGIPYIIALLSTMTRLYPGDIIATGTPAGVGHGFTPVKNLRKGDVIECEIEKLGILRNIFV